MDHKLRSIDRVIISSARWKCDTRGPLSLSLLSAVCIKCVLRALTVFCLDRVERGPCQISVLTLTPFYRKSHFHDRRSICSETASENSNHPNSDPSTLRFLETVRTLEYWRVRKKLWKWIRGFFFGCFIEFFHVPLGKWNVCIDRIWWNGKIGTW